jgi:ATP-dependent protease HslVU (ClpYQ) peptidase subunit
MTAIVGILNKQAVAVAADSAVTVGRGVKIYNTANKIFNLSKGCPVGIAIYGNAALNNCVPWEGCY